MKGINYFAERQSVKKVLNAAEIARMKVCYCYKNWKKYKRFYSFKTELVKKGFWTFSKHIKYWDIRVPEFKETNREFEASAIRDPTFKM